MSFSYSQPKAILSFDVSIVMNLDFCGNICHILSRTSQCLWTADYVPGALYILQKLISLFLK